MIGLEAKCGIKVCFHVSYMKKKLHNVSRGSFGRFIKSDKFPQLMSLESALVEAGDYTNLKMQK